METLGEEPGDSPVVRLEARFSTSGAVVQPLACAPGFPNQRNDPRIWKLAPFEKESSRPGVAVVSRPPWVEPTARKNKTSAWRPKPR